MTIAFTCPKCLTESRDHKIKFVPAYNLLSKDSMCVMCLRCGAAFDAPCADAPKNKVSGSDSPPYLASLGLMLETMPEALKIKTPPYPFTSPFVSKTRHTWPNCRDCSEEDTCPTKKTIT